MPMSISKIKHLLRNSSNQFLLRSQSLLLSFLFALLLIQSTHLVADEQYQELNSIEEAVKLFLGSNGSPQKLDPRLLLKKCHSKLSVTYPFNNKTTTQVRCDDSNGWKIFVSINYKEDPIDNPPPHDLHFLIKEAEKFIGRDYIIKYTNYDLALNDCAKDVHFSYPFKSKLTLLAKCQRENGWYLYIPLAPSEKQQIEMSKTEVANLFSSIQKFIGKDNEFSSDQSLFIRACQTNIVFSYPFNNKNTVQAQCLDENGWKKYFSVKQKTKHIKEHKISREELLELVSGSIQANQAIDIDSSDILSKECALPLEIEFPFNSKETIIIICKAQPQWSKYFSVFDIPQETLSTSSTLDSISSKNSNELKVVVASKQIRHGITLTKDDLTFISIPKTRVNTAHFTSIDTLVGMEPSQAIPRGTAITSNMVKPPTLVKRGEKVTIILEKFGLSVTNEGEALENGAYRQKINVFIPDTKQIIKGVVQSPGLIKIQ